MGQLQFRSDDTIKWLEGFGNGSDGAYSSAGNATDAPIDASCTATAGTNSISATNAGFAVGQLILIHKTRGFTTTAAGTWELNKISDYTAGTITTKYTLQNSYQDSGNDQSQVVVMKQYTNFTQNSGHTLTAKAWNGNVGGIFPCFVSGTITGPGTITASTRGFAGGIGAQGDNNQYCGEGSGQVSTMRTQNPVGNGGGAENVSSAGGGNATQTVSTDNCYGSADYNAGLTLASFGGGGGGGADSNGSPADRGGYGGGFILIIAKNFASSNQIVLSAAGETAPSSPKRAGSGGAGGCILLKSQIAPLGSSIITAIQGNAGSGNFSNNTNGSVGRIHLDYKISTSGSTNPTLDSRQDLTLDYEAGGAVLLNFV